MWVKIWGWLEGKKTLIVALAVEVLSFLDEFQVVDWSSMLGAEKGGRVAATLGLVIIVLRLVTRGPMVGCK